MTDFCHSNFTEAIHEINVTLDWERTKMGLLLHPTANVIINSVCALDQ